MSKSSQPVNILPYVVDAIKSRILRRAEDPALSRSDLFTRVLVNQVDRRSQGRGGDDGSRGQSDSGL